MKEHVYIAGTGERVRESEGRVEVGLSPEAQVALGHLLHFQTLKIGDRVKEGDRLFVAEGNLTAAEFYSPIAGYVDSVTGDPNISDWLVTLKLRELRPNSVFSTDHNSDSCSPNQK